MTARRYTVKESATRTAFVVKLGAEVLGFFPTRYQARAFAGEHAQRARGDATRAKGWRVDGRPER
jgi:hypothetical protein